MATVTIKIETRSKKAKYLLGLITELSKTDEGISFVDTDSEAISSLEQSFKELDLLKKGKLKTNPARDIISQL